MTRRCSHCSHDGHNSRTCPNRGVKLFGVRLTDGSSIRKSASMGNLSLLSGGASPAEGPEVGGGVDDGYASEDFVPGSSSNCRERKRGTPWTEDEHRKFLLGLKNLGKGDWRGISRNYVVTRTPTQVASHAQKYFIRQTNMTRRKRRSSLFDMVPDEPVKPLEPQTFPVSCQEDETQNANPLPVPPSLDAECESMDSNNSTVAETPVPQLEARQCSYYPVIVPAYCSPFMQLSLPLWPGYGADNTEQHAHEIVKPTAIHSKIPLNVDELVGISKLSIGDHTGETTSLPSVDLLGGSKRQSAFHASAPARSQA